MKLSEKKTPAARAPFERMLRIHQEIQAGRYPNASRLAAEMEVSTKSIQRDLNFMRDRFLLPIDFDHARNGFYYTEKVDAFPTTQITEGELFALIVAEKALQQYRGTTFEKPLLSAIKKLESSLPDTISLNMGDWDQTISFRTRAEPVLPLEIFDKLAKAVARRNQLQITYRKPGQHQAEPRLVDPYHLANVNGEWFLFAYDRARQAIRRFVPARILTAETTGKSFVRLRNFSIEQELRDSFGVHSAEGSFAVVVRFHAAVADYIREKKWHASQELRELKSGGVELRLTLSSLMEIQRWLLGWGGHAVVIKPPELAQSLRAAAQKILENHRCAPESDQRVPT